MKSLSDILRETGLSYPTIFKYVQLGILPRSERVWRGRKGSESWFPDDAVDMVNRVRKLKGQGYSLNEIAKMGREPVVKPEVKLEQSNTWGFISGPPRRGAMTLADLAKKYHEDEYTVMDIVETPDEDGIIVLRVELMRIPGV